MNTYYIECNKKNGYKKKNGYEAYNTYRIKIC